jgi:hypothetical protein
MPDRSRIFRPVARHGLSGRFRGLNGIVVPGTLRGLALLALLLEQETGLEPVAFIPTPPRTPMRCSACRRKFSIRAIDVP